MSYKNPKYSADGSINLGFDVGSNALEIGRDNLKVLKEGKGKIRFTGAYIHLTPVCNFRCEGCFTHTEMNRKTRLNFSVIKRIVDFAKDRGAQFIIFAGAGEPTLDSEFKKIVNYIKKQRIQTVLFTNLSTLKNKKQAKDFLESGPVVAKLYTLDEKKYNRITHCRNAFKYTMKGLKLLLEARYDLERRGKKVVLAIDSYITKENYMDLPNLLRYCRKNKIIPYLAAFIEFGQLKEIVRRLAISEKVLAQLFLKLQKIDKKEFGIDTSIYPWSRHYGEEICKKATHMFSVREDGNACMCVCAFRKVGNIFGQKDPYKSLEKIFDVKNKWLLNYFMCDKCSKLINPKYLN